MSVRSRMLRALVLASAFLILALVACTAEGNGEPDGHEPHGTGTASPALAKVLIHTRDGRVVPLDVEVADRDELRFCGLMHRLSMPEHQGMLFVFETDSTGGFWNRNTFIPLSLAWIAADGTLVDLTELPNVPSDLPPNQQPVITTTPRAPYRYVIEANQGWFARQGIEIGDRVDVSEAVVRGSEGVVPVCREKGF